LLSDVHRSIAPNFRPAEQAKKDTQNRVVASGWPKLSKTRWLAKKCLPQLVRPALTAAVHASCINILLFGGEVGCIDFFLSFDINIPGTGERSAWIPVLFMNIYLLCCGLLFFPWLFRVVWARGACRLSFPLDFGRLSVPFLPAASRDTSVRITRPA
jgi:hypothetical protein